MCAYLLCIITCSENSFVPYIFISTRIAVDANVEASDTNAVRCSHPICVLEFMENCRILLHFFKFSNHHFVWLNFWFKSTGIKYMTFSHHIENIYLEIRFRCRSLIQSSIVLCHHFPMHTLFLRFNFHSFSVILSTFIYDVRVSLRRMEKKNVCSKTAKYSSVCSALMLVGTISFHSDASTPCSHGIFLSLRIFSFHFRTYNG